MEAPFCLSCEKRKTCKKICPELEEHTFKIIKQCDCWGKNKNCKVCGGKGTYESIENTLPKPQGGINGKKVKFYDPRILAKISDEKIGREFTSGGGKRKQPHIYD